MRACPWCAEEIQDAARICRHCGRDASAEAQAPILNDRSNYSVPVRLERQSHSGGGQTGTGTGFQDRSTGLAIKGSVCPECRSANYANTYSVWHGVIALFAFPIGLVALAFPIRRCDECHAEYGAGKELAKVMRFVAIGLAGSVLFGMLMMIIASNL